jgi:hypothetical protein
MPKQNVLMQFGAKQTFKPDADKSMMVHRPIYDELLQGTTPFKLK